MPGINVDVDRQGWGAQPPTGPYTPLHADDIRGLVVHHSGSREDAPEDHQRCAARVRGVQRFHQQTRGWSDIGYHFIVCHHGDVFEGRPVRFRGAHAGRFGGNARWLGVCVLGDYSRAGAEVLPGAQRGLMLVRHIVLARRPHAVAVWPHRRFTPTTCPGRALREWCRTFP